MLSKKHDQEAWFRGSARRWVAAAVIGCFLCLTVALVTIQWLANADQDSARDALIVLDGASAVEHGRGAFGSLYVAYALAEAYPARNAIERISSRLGDRGWTPLEVDWLNPGLPSSIVHGWDEFYDNTGNSLQHVYQWSAEWRDSAGNLVAYSLRYSYLARQPPELGRVWVNGLWYPAASVKTMQSFGDRNGVSSRNSTTGE